MNRWDTGDFTIASMLTSGEGEGKIVIATLNSKHLDRCQLMCCIDPTVNYDGDSPELARTNITGWPSVCGLHIAGLLCITGTALASLSMFM